MYIRSVIISLFCPWMKRFEGMYTAVITSKVNGRQSYEELLLSAGYFTVCPVPDSLPETLSHLLSKSIPRWKPSIAFPLIKIVKNLTFRFSQAASKVQNHRRYFTQINEYLIEQDQFPVYENEPVPLMNECGYVSYKTNSQFLLKKNIRKKMVRQNPVFPFLNRGLNSYPYLKIISKVLRSFTGKMRASQR